MFFWNSLAFSVIQRMLAIWSLVPLPFLKTSLNVWKFTVHILLKPGLENFEHYFTSMWDECNCAVLSISQFSALEVGNSMPQPGLPFTVSQGRYQCVCKAVFPSGASSYGSTSRLIQVVGSIQLCSIGELRSPFPCWLFSSHPFSCFPHGPCQPTWSSPSHTTNLLI